MFKVDGALLASSSIDDPVTANNTAVTIAAIVSNIWSSFEEGDLEYQLFDCDVCSFNLTSTHVSICFNCCLLVNVLDTLSSLLFLSLTYYMIFFSSISKEGKVVVTRVSKLLLCIYSGSNVEFGMLKAKVLQFIHTTLTRKTTSPHPLMFSLPTVCITYTSSHSLFSLLFTGEKL